VVLLLVAAAFHLGEVVLDGESARKEHSHWVRLSKERQEDSSLAGRMKTVAYCCLK
jgi:hypothetical protein